MKKVLMVLSISLFLFSCGGYTTEEIETETKDFVLKSISETLDISSSNMEIKEYGLVQESDNVYSGLLKTKYEDMTQTWDVRVIWDHSTDKYTVTWELTDEK
ncbi:MAG: hypothetical protein ABF294_04745 [Flavobacteriales bacterium]